MSEEVISEVKEAIVLPLTVDLTVVPADMKSTKPVSGSKKDKISKPEMVTLKPEDVVKKAVALDAAMLQIEKQFGKGSIMKLGDSENIGQGISAISTGAIELDIALGIGGVPRGRVVEVYGPESSGKTTLTLHIIAEAQKLGGTAAFIDAEHALDPGYAKNLGVDISNLLISQPDSGEEALEIVEALVRSGALDVIVIDSVAALVPKSEIDGEMGAATMGVQARLMSQALRKLTGIIAKSNTCVIFINQLRCIDRNTLIITNDGIVKAKYIKDIQYSNIFGTSGIPTKITEYSDSGSISGISIESKYRGKLITGKDHRSPIIQDGKVSIVTSNDIKLGDYTIHPLVMNIVDKPYFSVNSWISISNELIPSNSIHPVLPDILDENLAMFLGMYYADGSILYDEDKSDYRIQFTEINRERYNLVKDLSIELFGDDRVKCNTNSIVIGGRAIVEYIIASGIGKNSPVKVIPDMILASSSSVLKSFITGAFFDTHGFSDSGFIFTCENEQSIFDFAVVLYSFGIFADIRKDRSVKYNRLYITGNDAIEFATTIGFIEKTKQNYSSMFISEQNSRGKYDIVPHELAKCVFDYTRSLKITEVSSIDGYNILNVICAAGKNIGRGNMLLFLGNILNIINDDYLQSIYDLCENNRFAEIISLEETPYIDAIDFSVSAIDELFIASTFLTHNSKIGVMFGPSETTTGGNALKFYASVRLDIRKIETLKEGDDSYGTKVRVKVVKNKVAPPFKQAEYDVEYGTGINKEGGILDLAVKLDIVNKAGTWYSYKEDRIGQGRSNAINYMKTNLEMRKEVEDRVREAMVKIK